MSQANVSSHFHTAYPKLHTLAEKLFRRQPSTSTLQANGVGARSVSPFADMDPASIKDREHFMAMAASAMHQILVDNARRRKADKRGGGNAPVTLTDVLVSSRGNACDVLVIHDLISRLVQLDPRLARVVEMRLFADMTLPEIVQVLDVSLATVEKDWRQARAWLRVELDRSVDG
jgi:RNA polymerase sigma-70 factor, ECF subfamily